MSRSRLGLYVFGRAGLFSNCYELQPTFSQLLARPLQLALVPGEQYGRCSRPVATAPAAVMVQGVQHIAAIVNQMTGEWEAAARAAYSAQAQAGSAAAAAAVDVAAAATAAPVAGGQQAAAAQAAAEDEAPPRGGVAEGEAAEAAAEPVAQD